MARTLINLPALSKKGDVIELGHVRSRYVEAGEVFRFTPDRAAMEAGNGPSPTGGRGRTTTPAPPPGCPRAAAR